MNNTVNEKEFDPRGVVCPCPRAIYMYITLLSNIFCSETAWPTKATCRVEPTREVGEKVYIIGTGHMTEMAAMLIYGKNLQNSNRPRYQVSIYRTIGPLGF